jgi:hypothetical protein
MKAAEAQIEVSQKQIDVLQKQIADTDAKAQQQIESLQKLVQTVKTPQQVVAQLPNVAPLPVQPTVQPDESISFPKEDVLPLFQDLADGKVAQTKLAQCQSDYSNEQQIAAQKDAQLKQKDTEILALKHKPGFWHRVASTVKQVGVGVGIGLALGAHL